jgi:hypothetical protein
MPEQCASFEDLFTRRDERPEVQQLLSNIKRDLPALTALRDECHGNDGEDGVYRFYHGSFKVYWLQDLTERIVAQLRQMLPERELNPYSVQIFGEGTGMTFTKEHNKRWLEVTRPIVEAFFHARYFLDMAVKYAQVLDDPPCCMPSGWAALLYLYDLR